MWSLMWKSFSLMLMALCLLPSEALAGPIQWVLNGVVFDDGGSALGSFAFNPDTGNYSEIAVETTAGTTLPGVAYPDFVADGTDSFLFLVSDPSALGPPEDLTGVYVLLLSFASPLTTAGGFVPLDTSGASGEILCASAVCFDYEYVDLRLAVDGGVTAVPEPSTVALVGVALAALCMRRRRSLT